MTGPVTHDPASPPSRAVILDVGAVAGYGWRVAQRRSGTDVRVLVAWTLCLILLAAGLAVPLRAATTAAAHGPAIAASASPNAVVVAPTRARPDAAPATAAAPGAPTVVHRAGDPLTVAGLVSAPGQRLPSDRGPPTT